MGPSGYNFTGIGTGTPNQDKRPFQFGTGTSGMPGLGVGQNLFNNPHGQSQPGVSSFSPGMQPSLGQTQPVSQPGNLFGFPAKPAGPVSSATGMNFVSSSGGIGGVQTGLNDPTKPASNMFTPTKNLFPQSPLFSNQLPSPQKPTTATSGMFQQQIPGTTPQPGVSQLSTQTGTTGIPAQGTGLFNTGTPFQGGYTFGLGKQPQTSSFLGLEAQAQTTGMSLGQRVQPLASQPQVTPQKQPTLGALQTPSPQTLHMSHLQTTPQNQTAQYPQNPLGQIGSKNPLSFSSTTQSQVLSGQPALFQLPSSPSTALTTSAPGLPQVPASKTQTSLPPSSTTTLPSLTGITLPKTSLPGAVTTTATASSVPIVSLSSFSTSGLGGQTQTPAKKYTYRQLEDLINNWVMELDEQQKVFMSQAKLVNAWDLALLENEDSIISLHDDVAKAKTDQDRLDHDLNSILNQQAELEEMLTPLETYLSTQSLHASTQHADQERNKTYTMAEKIDANMKDMMQNLREVLDRINAINSANSDRNNPISQITSILNAHMDSLLSIDDRSGTLQQKLDELSRKLDSKKQDQEARLKTAFS